MARLHPSLLKFGIFSGIVTVESFVASAMGFTIGAMVPTTEMALSMNEFKGLKFEQQHSFDFQTGGQV